MSDIRTITPIGLYKFDVEVSRDGLIFIDGILAWDGTNYTGTIPHNSNGAFKFGRGKSAYHLTPYRILALANCLDSNFESSNPRVNLDNAIADASGINRDNHTAIKAMYQRLCEKLFPNGAGKNYAAHHIDCNHSNNAISNIALLTPSNHSRAHKMVSAIGNAFIQNKGVEYCEKLTAEYFEFCKVRSTISYYINGE